MHLTPEQSAIIDSTGNIKINAVAGSGKTSTLIAYAAKRSKARRILYLAFNRSVRLEAQRRFADAGLTNVDVQTAHSLAYRHIVAGSHFTVAPSGYKPNEIRDLLGLKPFGRDPHAVHAVASHIARYASLFCNHATPRVDNLDYLDIVEDDKARTFVKRHSDTIMGGTRTLLAKMDRAEIPITHEFYLKKFQLSKPRLSYDCLLFDEGQDASPVMLDVFLSQQGSKVIVGDAHQQIYGWRWAVNALGAVDFADFGLTTSFRFGSEIAALACECLAWKKHFTDHRSVTIVGAGGAKPPKSRATIARTNLLLLKSAIAAVSRRGGIKKLYFEGNLNSYTYASEGASVYDVLNLYLDKKATIRNPFIAAMPAFTVLEEYAEVSEDVELGMLIDLVKEYGRDLPALIKQVRERHVDDADRDKAEMIFSTVHRCKGMEYGTVTLENDFVTEQRLLRMIKRDGIDSLKVDKLSEEVNLAYVAITRAAKRVDTPEGMFPARDAPARPAAPTETPKRSADWLLAKRVKHPNAYKPWSSSEDDELRSLTSRGRGMKELTARFARNRGAIRARLKKLGIGET